jgi:hypothetical protein
MFIEQEYSVPQNLEVTAVDGRPLAPESVQTLEYLRSRATSLGATGIRDRVRAAAQELENTVAAVSEADARLRPFADKWTIAEVVDHIAQTQIRAAEELRHLLAGRRPPGPPVYEALRSGAPAWVPWPELVEGLRSANRELVALLASAADAAKTGHDDRAEAPVAPTILVVHQRLPGGRVAPQTFVALLDWREYALVQRLHLLDHRDQVKKLRAALRPADEPRESDGRSVSS